MTPALRRGGGLAVAPQEAPQEAPPGGTERSLWCGVVNPTASPSTLSCRAHYSIKKSLPVYYEAALPCLPSLSLSFLLPSLSGCSLSPQCLPSPLPLLSLSLGAPPLSSGRPVHLFLPPLSSFPSPSSSRLSPLSPPPLPPPSLLFLPSASPPPLPLSSFSSVHPFFSSSDFSVFYSPLSHSVSSLSPVSHFSYSVTISLLFRPFPLSSLPPFPFPLTQYLPSLLSLFLSLPCISLPPLLTLSVFSLSSLTLSSPSIFPPCLLFRVVYSLFLPLPGVSAFSSPTFLSSLFPLLSFPSLSIGVSPFFSS